jgi:hypothetical protein
MTLASGASFESRVLGSSVNFLTARSAAAALASLLASPSRLLGSCTTRAGEILSLRTQNSTSLLSSVSVYAVTRCQADDCKALTRRSPRIFASSHRVRMCESLCEETPCLQNGQCSTITPNVRSAVFLTRLGLPIRPGVCAAKWQRR